MFSGEIALKNNHYYYYYHDIGATCLFDGRICRRGFPFGLLVFHHQFLDLIVKIVECFDGGNYSALSVSFDGVRYG